MKNDRWRTTKVRKHFAGLMSVTILALTMSGGRALADASVELRLTDLNGNAVSAPNPGGLWNGGESLLVEMWLGVSDMPGGAESLLLRSAQVNYAASPGLAVGQDIDVTGALDGIGNFWFDYSSLPGGAFPPGAGEAGDYVDFSNVSVGGFQLVPSTVYMGPSNGSLISLPAVQSPGTPVFVRLGAMPVTLPAVQGAYVLDLLHTPIADDFNEGTTITFGFGAMGSEDPFTIWSTASDDTRVGGAIAYAAGSGPVTFAVVPEPATVALMLALAVLAAVRRPSARAVACRVRS